MTDYRDILVRLHASNLLAWEDMDPVIAREVREALADDSTPSSAPTDSGAEPARGEGASARACWDCAHDSLGTGGGICLFTGQGKRHIVSDWIRDNCTSEPMPGACNCPGWAPREVSDE